MQRTGPFLFLVLLLFLAGASAAIYRHNTFSMPFSPGAQQQVWEIEARIRYTATAPETQVRLTLPPDQSGFRPVRESTASSGFGFFIDRQGQRRANWSKRGATGPQLLFYKLDLLEEPDLLVPEVAPTAAADTDLVEPYATAVGDVLNAVLAQSADPRSLAEEISGALRRVPLDQNLALLLDRYSATELLTLLLNAADTPARTVSALKLEDGIRRQSLIRYAQVWDGNRWLLLDPERGVIDRPDDTLLWQTQNPGVLEVIGGQGSTVSFSMIRQVRSALEVSLEGSEQMTFSLYSLPIAEQGMFKLIMLLPLGALVVVFMRLVVGLKTSGTFMPILLALSFLQTELLPGVISLLLVVMLGLMLRTYLSALNLLLVARIATLVILVIGIITVVSIVSYEMGLISGLTISFFPMIILAWTIERMAILWEEEGPKEVLVQGSGSLLVAILAFTLMDNNVVKHLAFNFPELHLCVLAVVLLLGRYTGYRLTELFRFQPFNSVPEVDQQLGRR